MGQLNFFMTNEEIVNEINQLLISESYTVFKGRFFDSETPESINNFANLNETKKLTIWVNNNKYKPKCSSKGGGKMMGKFLFDCFKDPIIEFDLGITSDNLLSPSRLFYKTGWVDDKELRQIHIKLTNKLVRTFKKRLTTAHHLKPFYISESIINLLNDNYELELGQGGMRVNKNTINGT